MGKLESSLPRKSDSTDLDFKRKETEYLKKEAKKSEEVSKTQSDKEEGELGWEELIEKLLEMFAGDDVNVEEVMDVLRSGHQLNLFALPFCKIN